MGSSNATPPRKADKESYHSAFDRARTPTFFWPLDENGAPLGDPVKLRDFLNADRSRVSWFPAGAFEALRQREVV